MSLEWLPESHRSGSLSGPRLLNRVYLLPSTHRICWAITESDSVTELRHTHITQHASGSNHSSWGTGGVFLCLTRRVFPGVVIEDSRPVSYFKDEMAQE